MRATLGLILLQFWGTHSDYAHNWVPQIVKGPTLLVTKENFPASLEIGSILSSNNNVAATIFEDTLFLAWRTSPIHFANAKTKMILVSSDDRGETWRLEQILSLEKDLREPYFLEVNGTLFFYYFEAGTNPVAFEPSFMFRMQYGGEPGLWSEAEPWGQESEVGWQFGVDREGVAHVISFVGAQQSLYTLGNASLHINASRDGIAWESLLPDGNPFYYGGVSEIGWAFDNEGVMWGVGRNEDGDASGWGSRILRFDPKAMKSPEWVNGNTSDPRIYESPRMFNHEGDLYLVARTDPNGPFMSENILDLPDSIHHLYDLVAYSLRSHGTAVWKLNTSTAELEWIMDLPGCGDTAFPSVVQTSDHSYMILNYSSPLEKCQYWPWIVGQVSPEGSVIYAVEVEFRRVVSTIV